MESNERYEPTLGPSDVHPGLAPGLGQVSGEVYQGITLVHIVTQLVGRNVRRVFYGDPLFEGSEVQWNDFVPRFHFPERFEFEFVDGSYMGFGVEREDFVGIGSEGIVGERQALINNNQEGYVSVTDVSQDPGWARRISSKIAALDAYLGEYWHLARPDWRDTRTEKTYGVRDLVMAFENGSKVYFSLSKSLKGLSAQNVEHERIAIVFDEVIAKKASIGPFNSYGKLLGLSGDVH
ncbi:MAG: hypothetical protein JWM80_3305 [Cyanobacteria bacterium RYN_339]|nr:hypothetical protein [Cyanobacteria bacterium RYN_339]